VQRLVGDAQRAVVRLEDQAAGRVGDAAAGEDEVVIRIEIERRRARRRWKICAQRGAGGHGDLRAEHAEVVDAREVVELRGTGERDGAFADEVELREAPAGEAERGRRDGDIEPEEAGEQNVGLLVEIGALVRGHEMRRAEKPLGRETRAGEGGAGVERETLRGGELADEAVVAIGTGGFDAVDLRVARRGEDEEACRGELALADGAALALDRLFDFRARGERAREAVDEARAFDLLGEIEIQHWPRRAGAARARADKRHLAGVEFQWRALREVDLRAAFEHEEFEAAVRRGCGDDRGAEHGGGRGGRADFAAAATGGRVEEHATVFEFHRASGAVEGEERVGADAGDRAVGRLELGAGIALGAELVGRVQLRVFRGAHAGGLAVGNTPDLADGFGHDGLLQRERRGGGGEARGGEEDQGFWIRAHLESKR
jgi:hypothetical protein